MTFSEKQQLALKALRFLTSQCDGASSKDGTGFNKYDTHLGHSLARQDSLDSQQLWTARNLLIKYKNQLSNGGIDTSELFSISNPIQFLMDEPDKVSNITENFELEELDDVRTNQIGDEQAEGLESSTSEQEKDIENTGIQLSDDQSAALSKIVSWWKGKPLPGHFQHLTLGGFAGTGKTTLMGELRKVIDAKEVRFCAFTGKASLNLRKKLTVANVMKPKDVCSTIHKFMYIPIINEKTGAIEGWRRTPQTYPDLIVVDESSMINREIFNDLMSLGIPILFVGDHGQLPPVSKGDPFNLMENPEIKLEKIHRQAQDSPIIKMSMMAREGKYIPAGMMTEDVGKINSFSSHIDLLNQEAFKAGELYILTDMNRRRLALNRSIIQRFNLVPYQTNIPKIGTRLICLKNNMKMNPPIFNGMHCNLEAVGREDNYNNFDATIVNDEGEKIKLKMSTHFFLNETGKTPDGINWKTVGEQFDYGYAMTVHKAQGSEADTVFVFGSGFGTPQDRARWLYTAITRAKRRLFICGDKI